MKTLCIQIQLDRVPDIDKEHIRAIGKSIALNKPLVSHFEIQEGDDGETSIHILFETNMIKKLWQHIQTDLFDDLTVGSPLSQSSIVVCEGENGWDDYLLLHHFKKSEKLDNL